MEVEEVAELKRRPGASLWMRACRRCGGAAYLDLLDEPEWRCLQCGRSVRPETSVRPSSAARAA
jgi:hypothetical protein